MAATSRDRQIKFLFMRERLLRRRLNCTDDAAARLLQMVCACRRRGGGLFTASCAESLKAPIWRCRA